MKQNTFSFDNLVNTMMPLPVSGNANGEGMYCRGQEWLASMNRQPAAQAAERQEQSFDLDGVFCQYCFD